MDENLEIVPERRKRIDIAKLKKTGAVVLPSIFTIANMAFGFFSILSASEGEYVRASWFLIVSYVMDMMDGRVARLVHGESSFGVEIDSLSDWISFGIAPAYLIYKFVLKDYGFWGYPVAFLYVLCGALRLARYNVSSHFGGSSKDYFQGLPIPAAAGILVSFVLAYSMIEGESGMRGIKIVMDRMSFVYGVVPFIMIALALLMVSSAPYAAFKGDMFKFNSIKGILFVTAVLSMIVAFPQDALFVFFSVYALSGVLAGLYGAFRKFFSGKEAAR
ncbi:MAG: CDP-diacylglycerol--serine O-phosphatidyltransferase [Elusimicrobia bacterium CG08_land_8_20_14_0_20_59_10]|nr:MAG: CDP-diacylglycerol--serine O-phosphatidyltransferase [Elusimicrobia bacterium CG08_land_8_20_14_0_20_59_10]